MATNPALVRTTAVILNIALKLDTQRENLERMKRGVNPTKPEHRSALQQIDGNIEHLQNAIIHLRHAADSLRHLKF
jgi:hypothetical protein